MDGVVAAVQQGKGKKGMDAMRALSAEIASAKERLLAQRSRDAATLQALTGQTLTSSLEETAASMAPLTGTVKNSADNARQAN
jgi:hypothetical protein